MEAIFSEVQLEKEPEKTKEEALEMNRVLGPGI